MFVLAQGEHHAAKRLRDPRLYALLALLDAIRAGRAWERHLAEEALRQRSQEVINERPEPRAVRARRKDLLAPLGSEVVFVGGCAAGLLVTDTGTDGMRATLEVDTSAQVASHAKLYRLMSVCG